MSNLIITKTNPFDKWKVYKRFKKLKRAEQSLETLQKNIPETFKINPLYFHYKLIKNEDKRLYIQ